ncbi:BnaC02g46460D [Brassica napus]|uniref:BnaC02g46460D protein n=1 Tax=Brassica napus TaxID=3708 RepID=A0A078J8I5_BRANA|nr:BnaC02g46460D [Brassica napus]
MINNIQKLTRTHKLTFSSSYNIKSNQLHKLKKGESHVLHLALTVVLAATAQVDGNIIFDDSYYVLPIYSNGGGLTLPSRGHDTNVPSMLDMNIRREPQHRDGRQSYDLRSVNLLTFVTAGRNPEAGEDFSRSFFQIHKPIGLFASYQIMFCPNNNDCRNIGVVVEEYGVPRLALSPMTFSFYFRKATEISSKTMSII